MILKKPILTSGVFSIVTILLTMSCGGGSGGTEFVENDIASPVKYKGVANLVVDLSDLNLSKPRLKYNEVETVFAFIEFENQTLNIQLLKSTTSDRVYQAELEELPIGMVLSIDIEVKDSMNRLVFDGTTEMMLHSESRHEVHIPMTTVEGVEAIILTPPLSNAGKDQIVKENNLVLLQGSAEDHDGNISKIYWSQTSGTQVQLSSTDSTTPSFVAPSINETLIFTMTVTDDDDLINSDEVHITISTYNAPTVHAGLPQSVKENSIVTLSGQAIDRDGTIEQIIWEQTSGTEVNLSTPHSSSSSFTAPSINETLTFKLTAYDNESLSHSSVVSIQVATYKSPVVKAEIDQLARENQTVTLSANAYDEDGSIQSIHWNQMTGTEVQLKNSDTITPYFTAPSVDEELSFSVTVTDNDGKTHSDSLQVSISTYKFPISSTGSDQYKRENETVFLSGVASDEDGDIEKIQWEQLSGHQVSLTNANTTRANFTAPSVDDTLVFSMIITDNDGLSHSDNTSIHITTYKPPHAIAGEDVSVKEAETIRLLGKASDSDGYIKSVLWQQLSGGPVTLTQRCPKISS